MAVPYLNPEVSKKEDSRLATSGFHRRAPFYDLLDLDVDDTEAVNTCLADLKLSLPSDPYGIEPTLPDLAEFTDYLPNSSDFEVYNDYTLLFMLQDWKESDRPTTDIFEIIKRNQEEDDKNNPNKGGGSGGGSNGGIPAFPPMPRIEKKDRQPPKVPDIHALTLRHRRVFASHKKTVLFKTSLLSRLDILTYKLQLGWEDSKPGCRLLKKLALRVDKPLHKAENLPNPKLNDDSFYIKLRHLGSFSYKPSLKGLLTPALVQSLNGGTNLLNNLAAYLMVRLPNHVRVLKRSPATALEERAGWSNYLAFLNLEWVLTLLDPSFNTSTEEELLIPTMTQYAPDWIQRNDKPTKAKFTFFNRFWLYFAPGLNDLVFKFFNSRFKYFMFLMARYEKAFRIHFHIQTITRLNQYFLSFFLTKNITFKNHKKIINSNIIVAYIKPNKRIYTSLKFLKLFLTFKKKEFFSSRVYFLIKYALFSERSFVNTYVSKLYSAFNKNLSNKVIKSPEAGQTIKVDEDAFSLFLEERQAEPITESVAAALALRKEYIQKVRKLKRERIQMKILRKN